MATPLCHDPQPAFAGSKETPATAEELLASRRRKRARNILLKLPNEILQRIFFADPNWNFVHASPEIGCALSGYSHFYRALAIVAFHRTDAYEWEPSTLDRSNIQLPDILPTNLLGLSQERRLQLQIEVTSSPWFNVGLLKSVFMDMVKYRVLSEWRDLLPPPSCQAGWGVICSGDFHRFSKNFLGVHFQDETGGPPLDFVNPSFMRHGDRIFSILDVAYFPSNLFEGPLTEEKVNLLVLLRKQYFAGEEMMVICNAMEVAQGIMGAIIEQNETALRIMLEIETYCPDYVEGNLVTERLHAAAKHDDPCMLKALLESYTYEDNMYWDKVLQSWARRAKARGEPFGNELLRSSVHRKRWLPNIDAIENWVTTKLDLYDG